MSMGNKNLCVRGWIRGVGEWTEGIVFDSDSSCDVGDNGLKKGWENGNSGLKGLGLGKNLR